jgi:glycosyltransferase involved in cell wall biosynthesis
MRLALIGDGRAEHVRRWVRYLTAAGDDLLLLSTHPCLPIGGVNAAILPGVFRTRGLLVTRPGSPPNAGRPAIAAALLGLTRGAQYIWQQAKTVDVGWQGPAARKILAAFRPDLVHAFRLQTEGYVAAMAGWRPLVMSTWGSDFIWFARKYPAHRMLARWALERADGLLPDCDRDRELAHEAGFARGRPVLVCPGNGGVDFTVYRPGRDALTRERLIVYPRGLVPSVRLDTLIRSLSLLERAQESGAPRAVLLVQSAFVPVVTRMVRTAGLSSERVRVMPLVDQDTWVALLQRAAVLVSPSVSDGTPNSMLEAMACGAFPVMGDLASIREWIHHGVNGLLFDPTNAEQLAACLQEALTNSDLRRSAQAANVELAKARADRARIMPAVRGLYARVASRAG